MSEHIDVSGSGSLMDAQPQSILHLTPTRRYTWRPQPDITAHELALCIGSLLAQDGCGIEFLPPDAKRHFEEVKRE